jgi:tRNA pseudouridine55 synthase
VLNLNKPAGVTSRDVVDRVGRVLRGAKLGHAGTLDPLATGVLVVGVGAATRLIEFVQRMPKTYRTILRMGMRSDTLDADGRVEEVDQPYRPCASEIEAVLATQVGLVEQQPPEFSALKIQGVRAYELARAGRPPELAPRRVMIHRIDVLGYDWPRLELEVHCGSGTYIRSLARDVGEALGCGALVEVLTRTGIGPFALADAVDPEVLSTATIDRWLRPALDAVPGMPRLALSAPQLAAVVQGRALQGAEVGATAAELAAGEVALVGPDGRLAAIAEGVPATGRLLPRRVLIIP